MSYFWFYILMACIPFTQGIECASRKDGIIYKYQIPSLHPSGVISLYQTFAEMTYYLEMPNNEVCDRNVVICVKKDDNLIHNIGNYSAIVTKCESPSNMYQVILEFTDGNCIYDESRRMKLTIFAKCRSRNKILKIRQDINDPCNLHIYMMGEIGCPEIINDISTNKTLVLDNITNNTIC